MDCKLPKMVSVQSTGCAPIVKAWEEGVNSQISGKMRRRSPLALGFHPLSVTS